MNENIPLRFLTATSLFDGHDASINIMRRILQRQGVEVVHLGHNRSVREIVDAAIQEDVQAVAVSSYQGGHMEFFEYMVDLLREEDSKHIRVFAGGGGVIVPEEAASLEAHGVAKIYSVEDGQRLGLVGMVRDMMTRSQSSLQVDYRRELERLPQRHPQALARCLSFVELKNQGLANEEAARFFESALEKLAPASRTPVLGFTGTGGSGKSSLVDEWLRRFLEDYPEMTVAVLSVDPSMRRTGGALLGDRIRMNAINTPRVFMRSIGTRRGNLALSRGLGEALSVCRAGGFDLILVETAGIGQSDTEIVDLADFTVYVMTPEYGAASQLEKIGMLDYADLIAINKADKRGAADALRDVRKQVRRNRELFDAADEEIPVYTTLASRYGDPDTDRFYSVLVEKLRQGCASHWPEPTGASSSDGQPASVMIPANRIRYLSEIADTIRSYKRRVAEQAQLASRAHSIRNTLAALDFPVPNGPEPIDAPKANETEPESEPAADTGALLTGLYNEALEGIDPQWRETLHRFDGLQRAYAAESFTFQVRGRDIEVANYEETLSHLKVPKVVMPSFRDWGDRLRWLMLENVPGAYPFTAGVFPFKRTEEDPTRMFAGEGPPERTNRRFHYIAAGQPAVRLSTAFDSVTLYGDDPHPRPDIYGKVGNSGVSICTVDDMKRLYSGFDLVSPSTSVSMTINGPAPIILAFFLNAAIDQQVERHLRAEGKWDSAIKQADAWFAQHDATQPQYRGQLPEGNDGLGLGLLGISGEQLVDGETYQRIREATLSQVRGTVQADILKEDQAQNTCIFSTDFALYLMGDIQQYFIDHDMPNFYSVSVSGYHMAEAGANPITQVAFTLANGFTFVEYYLSRGMPIDAFARNLSFFFSNGMDPEYAVIGRVARRIWAVALRERYGAGERAQKLKYHIQTSGRSLHAQEIGFNDIRTTLQALYAVYDNCNSLHTNAYDEAITTPSEESVRRAIAIQLIVNRELGLARNHNPLQGSFIIEEMTELVEEAILTEFDRLNERGGVLGAMETMYQRSKIQEESLYYEERKHSGAYPIVGINTFLAQEGPSPVQIPQLTRSTDDEKQQQIEGLDQFQRLHAAESEGALAALKAACHDRSNTFAALMTCVNSCSLGQISRALYEVGGQYRRNM
ncbi:MAG: methylmalonyl-CoA mutase family protein [SAR324 cluster bacterium]|nr:methylmalonyl-CoA mutase family protein [SAR324 cluster bacterium]